MALPGEEDEESPQTPGATDFSKAHCMPEPVLEGRAPKLWDGRRCCTQGHPLTNQDPKAEGGIESALPNDTHKATSLPSEDPYST